MSIPLWVLLGFAAWTLAILCGTIGFYRWSRILTGRAELNAFPADSPHGADWYRRAIRSHANALENLPIYTALVVVMTATGIGSPTIDGLAIALLLARILQTIVHIGFQQTNRMVGIRFAFFIIQILCMIAIGIMVAIAATKL